MDAHHMATYNGNTESSFAMGEAQQASRNVKHQRDETDRLNERITFLEREHGRLQEEITGKDEELTIYYSHVARLQKRLNHANQALEQTRAQLDEANTATKLADTTLEQMRAQYDEMKSAEKTSSEDFEKLRAQRDEAVAAKELADEALQHIRVQHDKLTNATISTDKALEKVRAECRYINSANQLAASSVEGLMTQCDAILNHLRNGYVEGQSQDAPVMLSSNQVLNVPGEEDFEKAKTLQPNQIDVGTFKKQLPEQAISGNYRMDPRVAPFTPSNWLIGSMNAETAPSTPLPCKPSERSVSFESQLSLSNQATPFKPVGKVKTSNDSETHDSESGAAVSGMAEDQVMQNSPKALPPHLRKTKVSANPVHQAEPPSAKPTDVESQTPEVSKGEAHPDVEKSGPTADAESKADQMWLDLMEKTRTNGNVSEVRESDDLIDLEDDASKAAKLLSGNARAKNLRSEVLRNDDRRIDDSLEDVELSSKVSAGK
ncbi:uncharacterized protein KY384_001805 [Bacidia gigantensis]|uniref:uncharacterized protein n=1 Tax=Bacidia gigantensis TaxID=2732470 RepID=UPI001D039842|nr:uncharacterized protein KY384_001805 [Bacidia gigantensis]KAG8533022.1 hypothetical protein KY384_001805 [Bacidia gigantensis]